MPRFSLIVATMDRVEEFAVLLRSLGQQELLDFELIVVDQNPDERLSGLIRDWESKAAGLKGSLIAVKHLRCPAGCSRARNAGLREATGEIIAFPDDDCWYSPDTLGRVDKWFRENETHGILVLGSKDELGRVSGNRWVQRKCDLNYVNVFRASATYTVFVRNTCESAQVKFDESLGPGAGNDFGCGDDVDYVIRLMKQGIRGRFLATITIGHPSKGYVNRQRARRYGAGFGRVLFKHSLLFLWIALVVFDFSRCCLYLVLGQLTRATHLWAHGVGLIWGYLLH